MMRYVLVDAHYSIILPFWPLQRGLPKISIFAVAKNSLSKRKAS